MIFEDHPILTMLGSLAAVATLTLLADAVTDPFASAGLLAAGVASSGAFGLGLAALLEAHPLSSKQADADRPHRTVTADPPALPPPDGPEGPEMLFADRVRSERDAAPSRRR